MGPGGCLVGTGYSPSQHPPGIPTPGTPLHHGPLHAELDHGLGDLNMVVGLKSVAQLSLTVHFSGFRGITEVYNLSIAGRINNHLHIPGFK